MKRLWFILLLALVLALPAHAVNDHNLPDSAAEQRAWFADRKSNYVVSDCAPIVPTTSLTLAAFACKSYATEAPQQFYIDQTAVAVTVPDSPTVWLAVDRGTNRSVAGWTRVGLTHYLLQAVVAQPADPPGGDVFLQVTVAGSVITAVSFVADRLVSKAETISDDLTTSSDSHWAFRSGAVLTVAAGKTLALNGPLTAGRYTIFAGSGSLGGVPRIGAAYPEWFGAKADDIAVGAANTTAINAAIAWFPAVEFAAGDYSIDSPILILSDNHHLRGVGIQDTKIIGTAAFSGGVDLGLIEICSALGGTGLRQITIEDMNLNAVLPAKHGILSNCSFITSSVFRDLKISAPATVGTGISASGFLFNIENVRVDSAGTCYRLGEYDVALAEGTTTTLLNAYAQNCGIGFLFDTIAGFHLIGSAADNSDTAISVINSTGTISGSDFEINDTILTVSSAGTFLTMEGNRFQGYGNDTTPPPHIIKYEGILRMLGNKFGGTVQAFTVFLLETASSNYLEWSGNSIDYTTQTNTLDTASSQNGDDFTPNVSFFNAVDKAISINVWRDAAYDTITYDIESLGITATHLYVTKNNGLYNVNGQVTMSNRALRDVTGIRLFESFSTNTPYITWAFMAPNTDKNIYAFSQTVSAIRSRGIKVQFLSPLKVAFTSGSEEPKPGAIVVGALSAATAPVLFVDITSGSFAGTDAAGFLWVEPQTGTFQAENLDIQGGTTNVMTIASDTSGSTQVALGGPTLNWVEITRIGPITTIN